MSPSSVTARVERVNIPTYPALEPDPNPMFFESRNIQGSKGNIYPHPYIDRLSGEKIDREYDVVYLENEYLQMMMLPEIGGRIFAGLDKTNGYDFFYRHKVIKPALIGLYGPWISGGVEFNWPQHHRPSTFDPTDFTIEEHPDGSQTVWMSEHDPLNRTKGMVGICLHPGKAYVETKVRLYNRTPFPQTFLWWANAGVKINERYQVIFPPDVHYAVYHVKNPVTPYPIVTGSVTFGEDYSRRHGSQLLGQFAPPPPSSPPPRNTNSLAVMITSAGRVSFTWRTRAFHQARNSSPGAIGAFGHTWQQNLMDDTGEYLELMAGVYTDNQPDFSWIMPYETRTFSQFWYPVQQIGAMKNANLHAAVNLEVADGRAVLGVYGIESLEHARVSLTAASGQVLLDQTVDLAPGKPFSATAVLPAGVPETDLLLRVQTSTGEEIIRYQPEAPWDGWLPEPYKAPPAPADVAEIEQLYLLGLHLEQYRHPTLSPEIYWQEALRRDPKESRVNLALGKVSLRRGLLASAEEQFRTAVNRQTAWNLNPYDGEPHYNLGLALQYQGRFDEAYKAFYKAAWNYAWQSAAYYALAQIDLLRKDFRKALDHLDRALLVNAHSSKIRGLKAAVLRHTGQIEAAEALAAESIALDLLDFWARNEYALAARALGDLQAFNTRQVEMQTLMRGEIQTCLDIAFDYANAGLFDEAAELLEQSSNSEHPYPLAAYTLAWLHSRLGDPHKAARWNAIAVQAAPDYCFPWRLEEMLVLEDALKANPDDPRACYYLGNLLYDKRRYTEAVALWQRAVQADPAYSVPWRNLGLAAYNLDKNIDAALDYFRKALAVNPSDPRLLLEYDNLLRRKAVAPQERLALLESKPDVTTLRDDLTIHLMSLYNRLGQPQKALEIVSARFFHAWEGGEGSVAGQYSNAHWILGRQALESGDAQTALQHFQVGLVFPENLGEHPFEGTYVHLIYYKGLAQTALGQPDQARASFEEIRAMRGGWSPVGLWKALAQIQLGQAEEGRAEMLRIKREAEAEADKPFAWNYFYSGNPNPTFEEDNQKLQHLNATFMAGMAAAALGDVPGARSALGQVLAADPSNLMAWEEYRRLG